MAELTFEYSQVGQLSTPYVNWSNLSNIVGADVANVTIHKGTNYQANSEDFAVYTNDSTTNGEYIVKVEIGYTVYASNNSSAGDLFLEFQPYNNEKQYFIEEDLILLSSLTTDSTTYWSDITNTMGFPGYGLWVWDDLVGLSAQGYAGTTNSSNRTVYVDKVQMRVTTSPVQPILYGLEVWDSTGNIILEVTDTLTRVIFTKEVLSTSSSNENITIPSSGFARTFGYSYALNTSGGMSHSVALTDNGDGTMKVAWTKQSSSYIGAVDSLIVVLGW
jgi:hypothetical protein